MLSIIIDNKELKLALDIAMDLTNKKTKNTIYDYVEIVVNNNVIEVRASDSISFIRKEIKGEVIKPGSIMVEPKVILKLLKEVEPNKKIKLEEIENNILVVDIGTKNPYKIRTQKGRIEIPNVNSEAILAVSLKILSGLRFIENAMDKDKQYINLKIKNSKISMSTTNGFRLAKIQENLNVASEISILLESKVIDFISKLNCNSVQIDQSNKIIRFSNDNTEFITKQILDPFPDVDLIVANEPDYSIKIETDEATRALRRLGALGENGVVHVKVMPDRVEFSVDDVIYGKGKEEVLTVSNGNQEISFFIKLSYLLDTLGLLDSVKISYSTAVEPVFIGNSEVLHIIMPVRM